MFEFGVNFNNKNQNICCRFIPSFPDIIMVAHISFNSQQLFIPTIPSSYGDFLQIIELGFSLSSLSDFDIFLLENEIEHALNGEIYEGIIKNPPMTGTHSINVKVSPKIDQRNEKNQSHCNPKQEMNAFMNALFCLSIINPGFDFAKMLLGGDTKAHKKDFSKQKKEKSTKQITKSLANIKKRSFDKSIRPIKQC